MHLWIQTSFSFTQDQSIPRMSQVNEMSVYNGEFWGLSCHFVIKSKLHSNKLLSSSKRTVFILLWPLVKLYILLFPVQEPPVQISLDIYIYICSWSFGKILFNFIFKPLLHFLYLIDRDYVCNTAYIKALNKILTRVIVYLCKRYIYMECTTHILTNIIPSFSYK